VAVVSISRIQQRRGRKNSATGFPQLASGEIGWAIDTQEMFIGNGSVSEGAPFVGNTKILTENDNIFDFAGAYRYRRNDSEIQTGVTVNDPVEISIQERLDQFVTVTAFGAVGDGSTDNTDAFQRALNQLYLNTPTKDLYQSRVILYVPPGKYLISEELKIPPFVTLVGAGIESTVLFFTGSSSESLFRMVDGASVPPTYTPFTSMSYLERPRYFYIEGMTLETTSTNAIVLLDNSDFGIFKQILFKGIYQNGSTPVNTITQKQAGVWIRSASNVFKTESIRFDKCFWNALGFGIFSETDHSDVVVFDNKFFQLYDAISIGGGITGAINTNISMSIFDLIDRHAIHVKQGHGNVSANNQYLNVGNANNGYASPVFSNIKFDTQGNQSIGDHFERSRRLKDQITFGLVAFKPTIETADVVTDFTGFRVPLDDSGVSVESFRLPTYTQSMFKIDYVIHKTTIGPGTRTGSLYISVDPTTNSTTVRDEYGFIGDTSLEDIDFTTALEDFDGDSIKETLIIRIKNPVGNGIGTVNYTYQTFAR
jgi:hypothetical protein